MNTPLSSLAHSYLVRLHTHGATYEHELGGRPHQRQDALIELCRQGLATGALLRRQVAGSGAQDEPPAMETVCRWVLTAKGARLAGEQREQQQLV